ncbi:MAG: hypothetical protein KU37_03960 [Sulfuricurvum sp. PC08-66]|nr:MAG: hypothetical protein KU37_03960 [Sulfuricurvum sp. PC08-66]
MAVHTLAHEYYEWGGDTLILNVLGTPLSKRDAIGKPKGNQLKISVKAQPEDGKATDYMVRFLAGEFGVSTKAIEVVYGRTSIHKQLRIHAPQKLPSPLQKHP